MRRLSRRQFAGSVGAGLLLAPFIKSRSGGTPGRQPGRSKRLLLFCTMGTKPPLWTPTGLGREHHHLERDDRSRCRR